MKGAAMSDRPPRRLVVASMLRPQGNTGVHTHFRQLLAYVQDDPAVSAALVTPFDWGRPLHVPVLGLRYAVEPLSGSAGVSWYRHGHEAFLRNALRRRLAGLGDCVIYAQDPPAARAALAARRGPGQQVVLAVHFRVSQADEWAEKGKIPRDGWAFRGIRQMEGAVIPRVDRIVYVSRWARDALTGWLPEAATVPSAVIGNFVLPWGGRGGTERATERGGTGLASRGLANTGQATAKPAGDLVSVGHLEPVKNHRYLLRVVAAARDAGQPLTLDIFGEGPLRGELQRLAAKLGVADLVRLRGFRRDVRDFLPGYRAYVHASYSESSSLAIMEAMDAGLPVVAARVGPIAELVDDGVEGRFWPLDEPARAAAVLRGLIGDETVRRAAARAARKRFERDYDASVVGPRLRSFLLDGGC